MKHLLNTWKFSKFGIGGVINYALKLGVTVFLAELIGLWYFFSYIISLAIVIGFSFYYNAYITYKITHNQRNNFVKYIFALLIISALDAGLVKVFTETIGLHYLISIIAITTFLFFVKYFTYGTFVFGVRKK